MKEKDEKLKMAVRESYGRVAEQSGSCCSSSCCSSAKPEAIAKKIGYTEEEMQAVPTGSNLGLGCGNPISLASLAEGETVLASIAFWRPISSAREVWSSAST